MASVTTFAAVPGSLTIPASDTERNLDLRRKMPEHRFQNFTWIDSYGTF